MSDEEDEDEDEDEEDYYEDDEDGDDEEQDQMARNNDIQNICIEVNATSQQILRDCGIQQSKMSIKGDRERARPMLVLDEADLQKLATYGWQVARHKARTEYDGVYISELVNDGGEGGGQRPSGRSGRQQSQPRTSNPDSVRNNYVEACMRRVDQNYNDYQTRIATAESGLEKAQKSVAHFLRELEVSKKMFERAGSVKEESRARFEQEFDSLSKMNKVTKVAMSGDVLEVHTEVLYVTDPRTKTEHELGRFRILIDCDKATLTLLNTTRRVNGHHAPHVFERGNPCLGTLGQILPELFGKYEYSALAQVAIQYLESVNVNDGAGQGVSSWPISRRGEAAQQAAKPVRLRKKKNGKAEEETAAEVEA